MACLFLFLSYSTWAQNWNFDAKTQSAYDLVLNLQPIEAIQLIPNPKTASENYVVSLAEAVELLITEDSEKFKDYEANFQDRLERKIKSTDVEYQFLLAEMRLQWAFIYLKFGHEFDAALNLRQAYQIADECRKKNPNFLPIRKTTGLLEIIIGSVPEKYNWVLGLMGMEGAIQAGLEDLELIRKSSSSVAFEADLLYSLIQGYVLQKPEVGLAEVKNLLAVKPDNRLLCFLGASLAIKNSQSALAIAMLDTLAANEKGLPLYYADYLRGEIFLHKADYMNAISSYRWFINHYVGQNYIKDAYYKMAICYWLNGNKNDASAVFNEAKSKGKESSEADKHAAKSLSEKELPHVKLSKVRYFTDGGYYSEAQSILNSIVPSEIPTKRDQVEFYYRKARLEHKLDHVQPAKLFYQQTIEMAGEENWYFAPNACLQLGYIALSFNNIEEAKSYFNRALSYNKHEYKNSIDSKAKTALAQIKRR